MTEVIRAGKEFAIPEDNIKYYASVYEMNIYVWAETTDGTELSDCVTYRVSGDPIKQIMFDEYDVYARGMGEPELSGHFKGKSSVSVSCGRDRKVVLPVYYATNYYWGAADFTVKSSNPNVAGAYLDPEQGVLVIVTSETKTGTATITITATDGSNKKATVTVKVK